MSAGYVGKHRRVCHTSPEPWCERCIDDMPLPTPDEALRLGWAV